MEGDNKLLDPALAAVLVRLGRQFPQLPAVDIVAAVSAAVEARAHPHSRPLEDHIRELLGEPARPPTAAEEEAEWEEAESAWSPALGEAEDEARLTADLVTAALNALSELTDEEIADILDD